MFIIEYIKNKNGIERISMEYFKNSFCRTMANNAIINVDARKEIRSIRNKILMKTLNFSFKKVIIIPKIR